MCVILLIGGRSKDEIIRWVLKKSGAAAKPLQSPEEFESFIAAKSVTIVGYFENVESDAAKLFSEVADSVDDHPFGLISDYSKFSDVEHKDTFVLYKDVRFLFHCVRFYLCTHVRIVLYFSLMKKKLYSIKQSVTLKTSKNLFLFIRCLL